MNMDEAIQVSCIIDKLPPFWKDFKHTLKKELTLIELGSHLRIEESLRVQDSDNPKGNNVDGPSVVNIMEHNNSTRYNDNKVKRKHHDNTRLILKRRQNLLVGNVAKVVTLKGFAKSLKEVVQQPEPELRKSKMNRTLKNFGPKFQVYLIEETRVEVFDQHSYCFNVEDDPNKFDEAMKSQDVAFWKEAINDEIDSIMGNNTWVLADLPLGCKHLGCK
ncbi:hypothetical protein Tco_0532499 [Tanacetum coccineum]